MPACKQARRKDAGNSRVQTKLKTFGAVKKRKRGKRCTSRSAVTENKETTVANQANLYSKPTPPPPAVRPHSLVHFHPSANPLRLKYGQKICIGIRDRCSAASYSRLQQRKAALFR
jgi:hypothetical protein